MLFNTNLIFNVKTARVKHIIKLSKKKSLDNKDFVSYMQYNDIQDSL